MVCFVCFKFKYTRLLLSFCGVKNVLKHLYCPLYKIQMSAKHKTFTEIIQDIFLWIYNEIDS